MSNIGFIKINGELLPIDSMRLTRGAVTFTTLFEGPRPAFSGPIQVFTACGEPVTEAWQDQTNLPLSVPRLDRNDTAKITYHWRVNQKPITDREITQPDVWGGEVVIAKSVNGKVVIPPPATEKPTKIRMFGKHARR